jgi:hypothetical protein
MTSCTVGDERSCGPLLKLGMVRKEKGVWESGKAITADE